MAVLASITPDGVGPPRGPDDAAKRSRPARRGWTPTDWMDAITRLGLRGTEAAIMTAAVRWADWATGFSIRPSIETWAEAAGCDPRTAQRAIRRLEKKGLLVCVYRSKGNKKASEYAFGFMPDEAFKPTIPTPAQPESHPGNPSISPRQSVQFTPADCHPNNHTNHQKHQSNGSEEEVASSVDGWMAKPPSEEPVDEKAVIRKVLLQHGVSGPNLDLLANAEDITPEAIASEFADIRSDVKVRKASAVLVERLAARFGVTLKRRLALPAKSLDTIAKLDAMRRRSSGFLDSEDRRTLK
ncbi:MAG: helix-turn-helix domain-containing protein [Phycisphaeraceae bacterium]|nr:helix-turn-helix domain-containing protein [Phycisphaeraceae bacterium]